MKRPLPTLLALLAATTLLAAGCEKSEPDPDSVPDVPAPASPAINFAKGGGFAPNPQRLVISADDELSASLAQGQPLRPIKAEPQLVATAREHLAALDFSNLGLPPTPPAADEFTYAITYGDENVSGGETQLRENRDLSEAIGALDAILANATEQTSNQPAG